MDLSKICKICISFLSVIVILSINTVCIAQSDFLTPPNPQDSALIEPTRNIAGQILAVVQVIGVAVAIIMLIVLAIKYMSSAPNDRAEIKKHAVVYIVGAIVLFAASGILGIIRGFAESIGDGSGTGSTGGAGTAQTQTTIQETPIPTIPLPLDD